MICTFIMIPKTFVPEEDQGTLYATVYMNNSTTVEKSKQIIKQIINKISQVDGVDLINYWSWVLRTVLLCIYN